jgi:hypothetical protein
MADILTDDVSINAAGDIRWTGEATENRHSILEFIQFLMDKQDDEQASGNDLLDITVETPFNRSTDQIVTLNSPFNIDDAFAKHLYDGSVSQTEPLVGGETLYSGLRVLGPVEFGTQYMIIQDGKVLPAFWGGGINSEETPSLVFSRHVIKSKYAGADIDGKRITVLARELGDQFRRFPATLGTGNGVAAIGNGADIFNTSDDATIAATDVSNTEGFQDLNIDGTGAIQEFYSQWDIGTTSINEAYEYTKWISQRSHVADSYFQNPSAGDDYIIDDDNATTQGVGQEFTSTASGEVLTGSQFKIKINAGDLVDQTGTLYCELWASDLASPGAPTGSALAVSARVLASEITTVYEDILFQFNRINPEDGTSQLSALTLTASTKYFMVIRHDEGTATNNFSVMGDNSNDDDQNFANDLSASWTGSLTDALNYEVYTSPAIHTLPGQVFQGINVEVAYDTIGGTGVAENNIVLWGTEVTYGTLVGGTFRAGENITFSTTGGGGPIVSGGTVLWDDASTEMIVQLDTPGASAIVDTDIISTVRADGAEVTAIVSATIVNEDKGGGTGVVLAEDDNTTDGEVYLQVLSGVNPVFLSKIYRSTTGFTNFVTATAVINTRTINPEFVGTSTGSNIIGSYGIGFNPNQVGSSDRFTDLSGTSRIPPNNVVFKVSGIESGDRVLVGPRLSTSLDRNQWLLATSLTTTETAVVVKTGGTDTVDWPAAKINWPASTTASGDVSFLRIELDSGIYKHVDYDSHNSLNTFVISGGLADFTLDNATSDNNVWLAFIDVTTATIEEEFTGVHTAGNDRDLFVRVRNGLASAPIKTFEGVSAQFLATAVTVAAIRTPDI